MGSQELITGFLAFGIPNPKSKLVCAVPGCCGSVRLESQTHCMQHALCFKEFWLFHSKVCCPCWGNVSTLLKRCYFNEQESDYYLLLHCWCSDTELTSRYMRVASWEDLSQAYMLTFSRTLPFTPSSSLQSLLWDTQDSTPQPLDGFLASSPGISPADCSQPAAGPTVSTLLWPTTGSLLPATKTSAQSSPLQVVTLLSALIPHPSSVEGHSSPSRGADQPSTTCRDES